MHALESQEKGATHFLTPGQPPDLFNLHHPKTSRRPTQLQHNAVSASEAEGETMYGYNKPWVMGLIDKQMKIDADEFGVLNPK